MGGGWTYGRKGRRRMDGEGRRSGVPPSVSRLRRDPPPPVASRQGGGEAAGVHSADDADAVWRGVAHPAQAEPEGDWRTWLFLGGRGAGKTRAGAEWVCSLAARNPEGRFALVGATLNDVREVMIEGASGILSLPHRMRAVFEPSRRRLVWENGAVAHAFSAEEPNRLRGPQFHAAWADEFCAWARPQTALANLRLGLRLGEAPRLCVTTTPRPIAALRALRAEGSCGVSQAGTLANAAHLAPGFVEGLMAIYGGTSLAAQEIEGLVVEGSGALFPAALLARARQGEGMGAVDGALPAFSRVVVAVDPPAGVDGAACGIVVAGRVAGAGGGADRFHVLADWSVKGALPTVWAKRALEAARAFGAGAVAAEGNQGGEMVRTMLKMAAAEMGGAAPRVEMVHASRSKAERAMPVAALYEQGRVTHCGVMRELEEELMALGSVDGSEPGQMLDRADALVWALLELSRPPRAAPRVFAL